MEILHAKNMWWEGEDFYVETEDGKVFCFEKARITDHQIEKPKEESAVIKEMPVSFLRFED